MGVNDSLGDRMKTYEGVTRNYLVRRTPVIIRIDGKAFHTFTRGMKKPFDEILIKSMWETAQYLCENIQGCRLAYVQSDEISLLLTDYDTLTTDAWFSNNIQKMVSISASMASAAFNRSFSKNVDTYVSKSLASAYNTEVKTIEDMKNDAYTLSLYNKGPAIFDSRAFNLPKEEVCNYFIWRQQDATRNSIEAVGQANFSAKQLHRKSCDQIQDMLFTEKGINWNDFPIYQKRGACISRQLYTLDNEQQTVRSRWVVDMEIPIFTRDREYIEFFL